MYKTSFTRVLFLIGLICSFLPVQGTSAQNPEPENTSVFLPVIFKDFDPAWQFQTPINVLLQPTPFSKPYLILDSTGRSHLLWDTYSGEKAFIYHSYLTDQGWTTPTAIAQTLGRSKFLNPPVAGNNNDIYLVWYNELNVGGPYRILYAAWDGTKWGPEYELIGQGKSIYINGMVRLGQEGIPNVALIDSDGFFTSSIYYQVWTGSGFSGRQQINRPSNASIVWLDIDNGVRFYGDDYNNSVRFSHWKNGSFIVTNQAIPGKINLRPTFLDGKNNLHLIRSSSVPIPGGNVTGIYHQCLQHDFSWFAEVVLSGKENIQNYVVNFDEMIQPAIAWSTNNNQTIHVTFWNGCTEEQQKQVQLPALPVGSSGWGDFVTVSRNQHAGKVCFLSKEKYTSSSFWMVCNR